MRCVKSKPYRDFRSLQDKATLEVFDDAVMEKAIQLQYDADKDTTIRQIVQDNSACRYNKSIYICLHRHVYIDKHSIHDH